MDGSEKSKDEKDYFKPTDWEDINRKKIKVIIVKTYIYADDTIMKIKEKILMNEIPMKMKLRYTP